MYAGTSYVLRSVGSHGPKMVPLGKPDGNIEIYPQQKHYDSRYATGDWKILGLGI